MNFPSLSNRLTEAHQILGEVYQLAEQLQPKGTLGQDAYSFYKDCGEWAKELQDAEELIQVRQLALTIVKDLPQRSDPSNPQNILFQGRSVPFYCARLLVLQAYIATTWAIYDSVSKVAGRLICVDSTAKDLSKPPKLPENFLGGKDVVGARMHSHLKNHYGWPIGFSYAIRNWLVHDGNASDGIELLSTREFSLSPYEISEYAWKKLEEKCGSNYKVNQRQTRRKDPWPWHRNELDKLLEILQEEVDDAVGILILWAVESIRSQAKLLLIRDMPAWPNNS